MADFSATDPDAGDTIEWTLSGNDDAYFDIGGETGVLTFKNPPDFEYKVNNVQKNTYNITVQASDGDTSGWPGPSPSP